MNVDEALKHYYNYDNYRSNQREIVLSLLNKSNTIAILPTGGGKSVCFQIPALLTDGLCIVITPLISLMNDQVYELTKLNIEACVVNSTLSVDTILNIYNNLDKYKFLYLSPERLENELFLEKIKNVKLSYVILDEAHCIELWGSNFRTSYQRIINFTKNLNVVIGCFTATSTTHTLNKIVSLLNLEKYNLFKMSLSRENLMFEVNKTTDKLELLKKYLLLSGVKIVYCSTVKTVEYLYKILSEDYNITYYHGRLDLYNRNLNQNNFIKGKVDLIIATNAFGMGINKSNVRYVIHYEISSSIEDYYQEAGRAGRDTLSSKCIILYNSNDLKVHYYQRDLLNEVSSRKKKTIELFCLEKFVNSKKCLEYIMKGYFNEESSVCGKCINCIKSNPKIDISKVLLNFDNIKEIYNVSNNNYFLLEEHLYKLKIKYKKYELFLKENKYNVKLIYNKKIEKLILNYCKNNKIKIKISIIRNLIYLNPYKNIYNIDNKYYKEIVNILEKNTI